MSSQSSNWIKKIVAVLCLAGSAMAIYNVNSDVGPLQKTAETIACGADGCKQLVGLQRMPTSTEFTFQVQENSSRLQKVECARAFLLFGDYDCKKAP